MNLLRNEFLGTNNRSWFKPTGLIALSPFKRTLDVSLEINFQADCAMNETVLEN